MCHNPLVAIDENLLPEEQTFAQQVRLLREERGWSQSDLAQKLHDAGIEYASQSTVSRIEKGSRPVRMIEAERLASIFGRSVHMLSHPDSRDAYIVHASAIHVQARRDFVRFKEALRDAAEAQIRGKELLEHLEELFGDAADLDRGTHARLRNLQLNIRQFVSMDLIEIARDIVYMAPETINEDRVGYQPSPHERQATDGVDQAAP